MMSSAAAVLATLGSSGFERANIARLSQIRARSKMSTVTIDWVPMRRDHLRGDRRRPLLRTGQCLHPGDAERLRSVFLRTIQFQHIVIAIQPLIAECRPICALVHFPCLNSRAVAGSLSNIVMFAANGVGNALMDHRKAEFVYIAFYLRFT
jgi:hypothetical protein